MGSTIHQILGRIDSPNAKIASPYMENTTRWVFDLEHDGEAPVLVILWHKYASQRIKPAVQSFSIAGLSAEFSGAQVWIEEITDALSIHASTACKMRVAIDTIHTMAR